MSRYSFRQVDVFASGPFSGNPVAVIGAAEDLTDDQMWSIARWTNLSETTFVLPPCDPAADYRVRIFGPGGELPFAGHPTLGTAHAWLEAGGTPKIAGRVVQECVVGLIDVRRERDRLAFKAPGLIRSGSVDNVVLVRIIAALGISIEQVAEAQWVDNGPGWIGLLLRSADDVLGIRPDLSAIGELVVGVIGPHQEDADADFEVRAFAPIWYVSEDPVTGSLNAGLAQWLISVGLAPSSYTVRQGTTLRRSGMVSVAADAAGDVWVGGRSATRIVGTVEY